jgi:hypothetical protein
LGENETVCWTTVAEDGAIMRENAQTTRMKTIRCRVIGYNRKGSARRKIEMSIGTHR